MALSIQQFLYVLAGLCQVQEWFNKAAKFEEMTSAVKTLSERLFHVRNRSLLYELYPYVWDMRGVVSLLNSYVQWLGRKALSRLHASPVLLLHVHTYRSPSPRRVHCYIVTYPLERLH